MGTAKAPQGSTLDLSVYNFIKNGEDGMCIYKCRRAIRWSVL